MYTFCPLEVQADRVVYYSNQAECTYIGGCAIGEVEGNVGSGILYEAGSNARKRAAATIYFVCHPVVQVAI